jgi:hypothetical protein
MNMVKIQAQQDSADTAVHNPSSVDANDPYGGADMFDDAHEAEP